ncbi:MAG: hypothetical protein COA79_20420 [Planctomycetota bacterium]|nr:MAG: hypothetical protein COA79_20420 [Planctomycetota bacterium]
METPAQILFFANGNTAVFDKNGEQIGELQEAWDKMYVQFLGAQGFTPEQLAGIQFTMPDRRRATYSAEFNKLA